jgi:hypothetical protein
MSEQSTVNPGSPQWLAWREFLEAKGQFEFVARMDKAFAARMAIRFPKEWPTETAKEKATEDIGTARARTPLSEGARWLGLYGDAETPLIDANSPLVKIGVRPSDKLVAVTTRQAEPPLRETRWIAADFLRKAPALRRGQHVSIEWERAGELKTGVAIVWGILLGKPELLLEEDCVPFLKAHPLTRKHLLRWWMERHPEAPELAEAALKAMNPRELLDATLLADNEAARPMGGRHQVSYRPDAELWKIR